MTKFDYISILDSSLDFLAPNEKDYVLNFFQEKFSFCSGADQENELIEVLGAPDRIAEKLQIEMQTVGSSSFDFSDFLESFIRGDFPKASSLTEEDVIFSRPIHVEKASEIVHSMEDREVKTLFGEKVVVENRKDPIEEKVLEPIDEANGLTTEEIRLAKEKTLKKAETFSDDVVEPDSDKNENTSTKIPLEEEEPASMKKTSQEKILVKKDFTGIFNQVLPKEKYKNTTRIALLALLTLALSPLLILVFGLVLSVYAILVAFTVSIVAALFLLMIALIATGVVELVHGFLVLFDSLAAALIELGFGTILFSLVVAIGALIYEFIFAIVPKWLKWITKILVHYTKLLYCFLYGGKA